MQHDSLDLDALQRELENEKEQSQRRLRLVIRFMVALVVISLIAMLIGFLFGFGRSSQNPSVEPPMLVQVAVLSPGLMPFLLIWIWGMSKSYELYRRNKLMLQRIKAVFPEYQPDPRKEFRYAITSPLAMFLLYTLVIFVASYLFFIAKNFMLLMGIFVGLWLALSFMGIIMMRFQTWATLTPLWNCDYETAKTRNRFLRRFIPNWLISKFYFDLMYACAFVSAGEFKAAEAQFQDLRQRALDTANVVGISVVMGELAENYIAEQHYEDSLPLLENAIRIAPQLSSLYGILAKYYLEQQVFPERALELAQISLDHAALSEYDLRSLALARAARTLANLLKFNEAEELLQQVKHVFSMLSPFVRVSISLDSGYVQLFKGDLASAQKEFQYAAANDPAGYIGKLAQRELDKLVTEKAEA